MGRRKINTTKSGKYMNPTDQARKEARKKELKKNKKQRQMVRAAVLKGKDPAQLIEEMEKIDEMEYNVYQPSPLNEKVLKEKRKKLKETFDRVMRLYHNDDPDLWADLKRKEVEYEKRRNKKVQYYESVKHAQTVQIDEIPLPQMVDENPANMYNMPGRIPLPSTLPVIPPFVQPANHGILKKPPVVIEEDKPVVEIKKKDPPGCPPGPPPDIFEMLELDSDYEDDEPPPAKMKKLKSIRFSDEISSKETESKDRDDKKSEDNVVDVDARKPPTSLQQRMLAISGQNIDEFMKEMENVHKKKEKERAADLHDRLSAIPKNNEKDGDDSDDDNDDDNENDADETESGSDSSDDNDDDSDESQEKQKTDKAPIPLPPTSSVPITHLSQSQTIKLPSGPPPPPMGIPPTIFRPPPLRPGITMGGIRMPPGPPPGRPGGNVMSNSGPRMGIRMPPGPPPGMPPNRLLHNNQHNKSHHSNSNSSISSSGGNIVSAAPLLTKDTKGMTTITAKPQIRNLSADVTRFVPSTLRVKREDKKQHKPKSFMQDIKYQEVPKGTTKDDAYMQFMREMQGLL